MIGTSESAVTSPFSWSAGYDLVVATGSEAQAGVYTFRLKATTDKSTAIEGYEEINVILTNPCISETMTKLSDRANLKYYLSDTYSEAFNIRF